MKHAYIRQVKQVYKACVPCSDRPHYNISKQTLLCAMNFLHSIIIPVNETLRFRLK